MSTADTTVRAAPRGCIMVIDDEPMVVRLVSHVLLAAGFDVRGYPSASEALQALRDEGDRASDIDVVLIDLHLEDATGMDVLASIRADWPNVSVLVMSAPASVGFVVSAMRAGAYDYLVKPFDPPEVLVTAVERATERKRLLERNAFLERQLQSSDRFPAILGHSVALRRTMALVESVAPLDTTVLLLGESGTGKELAARAIHEQSPRASRSFVAVNCGAFTESILESELFGHGRGAFSGAIAPRKGLFEQASGGTLYLDDVGELTPSLQARLLRVLEEREVRPVGSGEALKVDVRLVAATHRDLAAAVAASAFRGDLYYRLNVVCIEMPPLRDRAEDIPALTQHFLALYGKRFDKPVFGIDPEALEILSMHDWPGNVRELQNAVERAVLLSKGDTLTADLFPPALRRPRAWEHRFVTPSIALEDAVPLAQASAAFERAYIESALRKARGNIAEAARSAGVDRSNFRRLLKRYGIDARTFGVVGSVG